MDFGLNKLFKQTFDSIKLMKHNVNSAASPELINNSFLSLIRRTHIYDREHFYPKNFRLDRSPFTNEGKAKGKSVRAMLFKFISSSVNDGVQRNSFISKYAENYISFSSLLFLLSNFII